MSHYLTIVAAAEMLRTSRSHLYVLVQKHRLQVAEIEGRTVVTKASVERYLRLKKQLEAIRKEMQKDEYRHG